MQTGYKIAIWVGIAALVGGGIYLVVRKKPQEMEVIPEEEEHKGNTGTGGGKPKDTTKPKDSEDITTNIIPSESKIGKTIYAQRDGVKVWSDNLMKAIYKTASRGEWLGKIASITKIGNTPTYKTEHGKYIIISGTYLQ